MSGSGKSFSEADFLRLLENDPVEKPKTPPRIGFIAGAVIGGVTLALTTLTVPFILPSIRRFCLPYVPATREQVKNVVLALKGRSGKLVDLGSGDGRIVLATAKEGFESTGVELNSLLVLYSKFVSIRAGLYHRTKFYKQDLWTFDLKPYRNVVIFGVENMMQELEKKFQKELDEGTQIVSCRYPLPCMKPDKIVGSGIDKVWIYMLNKAKS